MEGVELPSAVRLERGFHELLVMCALQVREDFFQPFLLLFWGSGIRVCSTERTFFYVDDLCYQM